MKLKFQYQEREKKKRDVHKSVKCSNLIDVVSLNTKVIIHENKSENVSPSSFRTRMEEAISGPISSFFGFLFSFCPSHF